MQEEIRLTQFSKGGGCGCKISPSILQQMLMTGGKGVYPDLLVGNESNDDAAIYRVNEETAIISTTDFFVPIVDDPYDFGRIAAANSISDVYAMGGKPMMAIAILGWPIDRLTIDAAQKVLEGGRHVCAMANIPLAGGHTIDSTDPIFGLSVTGLVDPKKIKRNNTAREGDHIFLTKPVGSGILATALKRGLLKDAHYKILVEEMTSLNKIGESLGSLDEVHAMTDVTGFGLLGHLIELVEGSGLGIELNYHAIKKMEGVDEYLAQRTIPDATFRNWNSYSDKVQFDKGINVMEAFNLLPDPQTNGGLLICVAKEGIEKIQELFSLNSLKEFITPIGFFHSKKAKLITVTS